MEKVYKYEQTKLIENMDENSYNIDMIEYIKSLPILTNSEKDKLIDTHKKACSILRTIRFIICKT